MLSLSRSSRSPHSPGVSAVASSVLNNNGIAQVGLLENICPFPRLSFCRDSFGLPHNDAARLWSSHSRIHEGERTPPPLRCHAMPCHVASHRVAFRPFLFRRFNCCANICLAGIDSAVKHERRHVNNTITAKVTRIDS